MRRQLEKELLDWKKNSPRKPLIIRGARQVGKTFTVTRFGKENFSNLVSVDLERDYALRKIFDGTLAAEHIVRQIELFTGQTLNDDTLLFIDEIQAVPRAITALRYLYEERPDLPVIAAGSALEFALGDISFPVGRVSFLWMRPMNFFEFLLATGYEMLANYLPDLEKPFEGTEVIHEKILEQLRKYLIVGGLPEAVKRFVENNSFVQVAEVHRNLAVSLTQSLIKYQERIELESLDHVFRQLPRAVGSQIKFTHLDPDRRIEKTKTSLWALERALLCHSVHSVDANGLPLGGSVSEKRFKPLFLDVGLMQYLCGLTTGEILNTTDIGAVYRGAVAEQFVGQELLAQGGSESGNLYYWSRADKRANAEVDYLLARKGIVYPIEVKSGAAGRMRSMLRFLEEHPDSPYGIAFSPLALTKRHDGRILFVPIYTRFDKPSF